MDRTFILTLSLFVAAGGGCSRQEAAAPSPAVSPAVANTPATNANGSLLAIRYAARETVRGEAPASQSPKPTIKPSPWPIAGTWHPSGWMGDAAGPAGALAYRIKTAEDAGGPAYEEWNYDPARGQQHWCGVAYQSPDNNWGEHKGKDLRGKGFTRLTLMVRGAKGGEQLIIKSGGHTSPTARHQASYEASLGMVTLSDEWKLYSMPLAEHDLSNVTAALVLVFTEHMTPHGCVVQVRDVAFRGPQD